MKAAFAAFAVTILLSGAATAQTANVQTASAPPGAAACSGCHAVNKAVVSPLPRLNGVAAADITAAMMDFRSGTRPATVMDRIAKGFSDDEIKAIAVWWNEQRD